MPQISRKISPPPPEEIHFSQYLKAKKKRKACSWPSDVDTSDTDQTVWWEEVYEESKCLGKKIKYRSLFCCAPVCPLTGYLVEVWP